MKATILDTKTGLIGVEARLRGWDWYEGNWSCDCNRNLWREPDEDDQCECKRYLVIDAEYGDTDGEERYTLAELNQEYPLELLEKHGLL